MPVVAAHETMQLVTRQTRRLSRHLALQIKRVLKSCDPNAVHQVRVAIRRFSQGIVVCKPCFAAKDLHKCRRRLKKIMSAAGQVRNCDIADKFIDRWSLPRADRLRAKLEIRREDAARVLVTELKRWTDRKLTARDCAGKSLQEMAREALDSMAKDFHERGNEAASPKASPHDMHSFRIVAKKFRYTLELFDASNPLVAGIKRVSALLGDINDCVTAAVLVPRLGAHLKKRQRKKTEEFRQYWALEFAKPRKKPVGSAQASRRQSRPEEPPGKAAAG